MSDQQNYRDDLYSKAVRAGKRTYFFDVRCTKGSDLYLTITESKRRFADDGKVFYEKHKLFLYKEDFEKFAEGLEGAIDKIKDLQATGEFNTGESRDDDDDYDDHKEMSDISFEDLGNE